MKTRTEYTVIYNWTVKTIREEQIAYYKPFANIYYLNWVNADKEQWQRASDRDILLTSSFCIDIDLRNQSNEAITNDEIINEWMEFIKYVDDELFKEWSKVVFTGNGLHIHYYGNTRAIDKNIYKDWVSYIFNLWDDYIGDYKFYSDKACCNIARILRLPWTINQKNWAEVKILWEQKMNSQLFNNIEKYAQIIKKQKDKETKKRAKETIERLATYGVDEDYSKIQRIPAYEIALLIHPEFPFDWKKNFKNNKGGFVGYFYNKSTNSICNWWSRFFNLGDSNSCYAPFQLIKNELWFTNRETFEYFKQKK